MPGGLCQGALSIFPVRVVSGTSGAEPPGPMFTTSKRAVLRRSFALRVPVKQGICQELTGTHLPGLRGSRMQ
jgi:hypothetical protein